MSTAEEQRRPRIVVDTNVFVSALNFGGKPDEVLAFALEEKVQLIVSPVILAETAGVLVLDFGHSRRIAQSIQQEFYSLTRK